MVCRSYVEIISNHIIVSKNILRKLRMFFIFSKHVHIFSKAAYYTVKTGTSINLSTNKFHYKGGKSMVDDMVIIQQEPVPPATEIDCIETNKVFDECLVRDCFIAPVTPGVEVDPSCITDISCSDFEITVDAPIVPTRRASDEPGFVRISFPFTIEYNLNILTRTSCAPIVVAGTPVTKNVSNVQLYCPEAIAYILTQQGTTSAPAHLENTTIKLEFIGECVDIDFAPSGTVQDIVDITAIIGYYLVIKYEQVVQIQVLSRGYCIAPICSSPSTNPCDSFISRPIPAFFPAQRAPF